MRRRDVLIGLTATLAAIGDARATTVRARASWPTPDLALICPYAPGGGTDGVARLFASELERRVDVDVTTINIAGAATADGHGALMRSAPDGGTIGMVTFALITLPLQHLIPFTWRDLDPLARIDIDHPALVVPEGSRYDDLASFLRAARREPKAVTIAHSGPGSAWHLAALAAGSALGFTPALLPRDGAAESGRALSDGLATAAVMGVAEAVQGIAAKRLRLLAIMGPERSPLFPDVPTFAELNEPVQASPAWRGLALPLGVPKPARDRIRDLVNDTVASDEMRAGALKRGFAPAPLDDRAFRAFLDSQSAKIGDLMRTLGAIHR